MKIFAAVLIAFLAIAGTVAQADDVSEITDEIKNGNALLKKTLKGATDDYSKDGALEFWSSGGLLHEISPGGRPGEWDSFNIEVSHIRVTPLTKGKVAMAHYYSEGSMKPKGSPAVAHYFTRVSQVFVNENGKWKVRASHWSPVSGGSGTSQTALEE